MNKKTISVPSYTFHLSVIGILFFIFGFITWANSQLIPYLKIACELSETRSMLVGSAFFAAYFVMAIPSAILLRKTGFKLGMCIGLFIMAAGALLFIPAAKTRDFELFLLGLFTIGSGLALLQTAANPYVTALGDIDSAAVRISVMGICNKIAGIVAVYVFGFIALKDIDILNARLISLNEIQREIELQSLANRVIVPYILISVTFVLVGIILWFIKLPEIKNSEEYTETSESDKRSIWSHKNLVYGVIALFLYVGVEAVTYDGFSAFGADLGFNIKQASSFVQYTGYALLAGYIFCIFAIPKYLGQRYTLKWFSLASAILVILACFSSGWMAVFSFALLGFTQSIMWPAIFPLAIDGLGEQTKMGSAYLIMAIIGGAILLPMISWLKGFLPEEPRLAYLIMVPCYIYIFWYAIRGYRHS